MSASYYIEHDVRVIRACKALKNIRTRVVEKVRDSERMSAVAREAARRELLRRKIWGQS